ncbi:hypothetical protein [Streptomyces umbrinus]|uniref:hypothetical protein n=1 Tax=Streptomyces umbrinus TaxID=67370 RepID=UPI003C2F6E09
MVLSALGEPFEASATSAPGLSTSWDFHPIDQLLPASLFDVTLTASSWYESGTFWTILFGVVATACAAILGAWATLRAGNPKRRLNYCLRRNIALINNPDQMPISLAVSHGVTSLQNPRLAEVQLWNDGRLDITANDFHNATPIKFDFGAPVVAVLGIDRHPGTAPEPDVTHEGTFLKLNPSLLPRSQSVSISVLVDREDEADIVVEAALVNVRLNRRYEHAEPMIPSWKYTVAFLACSIFFAVAIITAALWYNTKRDLDSTVKDLRQEYKTGESWIKYSHQLEKDLETCRKKGS